MFRDKIQICSQQRANTYAWQRRIRMLLQSPVVFYDVVHLYTTARNGTLLHNFNIEAWKVYRARPQVFAAFIAPFSVVFAVSFQCSRIALIKEKRERFPGPGSFLRNSFSATLRKGILLRTLRERP